MKRKCIRTLLACGAISCVACISTAQSTDDRDIYSMESLNFATKYADKMTVKESHNLLNQNSKSTGINKLTKAERQKLDDIIYYQFYKYALDSFSDGYVAGADRYAKKYKPKSIDYSKSYALYKIKTVRVVTDVAKGSFDEEHPIGVTPEEIKTAVELKMRQNGISVNDSQESGVELHINI